jgi:hypothetical protein
MTIGLLPYQKLQELKCKEIIPIFAKNLLKMRKITFLIFILTGLFARAQYSPSYVQRIDITNDTTISYTDYQVLLDIDTKTLIDAGKLQLTASDLRFSTEQCDPTVFLDYCIGNYVYSDSTEVWVRLPQFNAGMTYTIYMFYGDPLASAGENFSAVFPVTFYSSDNFTLSGQNVYDYFVINASDTLFIPAGDSTLSIHARCIIIDGEINGNGKGYQISGSFQTIGTGHGGGGVSPASNSGAGGGAYGGNGGSGCYDAGDTPGVGGIAYGTPDGLDIFMGSSGGSSGNTFGGNGGGCVRLDAELIHNNGSIRLNGAAAQLPGSGQGGGGGAGGGLVVFSRIFKNEGIISARGGQGSDGGNSANDGGGGGGGGRVKLLTEKYSIQSPVDVLGGPAGIYGSIPGEPGDTGTVFSGYRDYPLEIAIFPEDRIFGDSVGYVVVSDSYLSPDGSTILTSSGVYSDTLTSYLGCDSIFTLDLTLVGDLTPELMYYNFNGIGTSVPNLASNPPVGTGTATIMGGVTQGSSGFCGGALIGSGAFSTTDYLNTGWVTALGNNAWTISFWSSGISTNATLYYVFGDGSANSFRCFTNGVAGSTNWVLRATGMTDVVVYGAALMTPTMTTFVYDPALANIKAYLNGTLVNTVVQPVLNITGTGFFKVMGYNSNVGAPAGGLMDEFRMYNRALSDAEVMALNSTASYHHIDTVSCESMFSPDGLEVWTTSGIYTDTLVNMAGCDSVLLIDLTIDTVNTGISALMDTLTADMSGASYQWLDCNTNTTIPGETAQSFIVTTNGDYAVIVTNGACVDTSVCYAFYSVGIAESPQTGARVVPNPNRGQFTLHTGGGNCRLEVLDMSGHQVYEGMTDKEETTLDLAFLAPGVYTLVVKSTDAAKNILFVITP